MAALFCLVEELLLFELETFPEALFELPEGLVVWFAACRLFTVVVVLRVVEVELLTDVLLFDLLVTVVDDLRDEEEILPEDCLVAGDCETVLLFPLSPVDTTEGLVVRPGFAFT